MVHSSTGGLVWSEGSQEIPESMALVLRVLDTIRAWIGPDRTLAMPTHPWYRADPGYHAGGDKRDLVLTYDPRRTPSSVGLVSEAFRRTPGTARSRHPLQSVSAIGPKASWLVGDVVASGAPPHGPTSPYGRLCEADGLVVSIGLPLAECFTVIHAAEDARDLSTMVPTFYRPRRFRVVEADGEEREVAVRERRPQFARSYAKGQLERDLRREGILHCANAEGVRVDWLRAGSLFAYLMSRNRTSTYPYFLTGLASRG
ncbi:MAG: AAC(3) family N-acetyltransferase [Gemmatimonadaceae bacterium]|nr:AAC(3) family N-acetyltransferase [Gemmatimonadaceae bacterium]